ncbi:MAG: ribokinase [Actinophytocola sp.]|uniref:carbohydrate kinase family protein n=1 Tax=Actinophytocola sp. TaxID=1872138 RepID=UPI001323483D|nr:PfkB family carbohydrate kinase [Actinophytocola sp.]MPZ84297.1 ribokinase [Actinophytocola sp.]
MSELPVVFVGVATLDAIAVVPHLPAPDERQVADDMAFAGGGPAATAAVAAVRLGLRDVSFVGSVGDDDEGTRILAGLRAEGVDVSAVRRVPRTRSQTSVVLVERDSGTRAICTRDVPALRVEPGSPAAAKIRGAAWVHVDHLGWPAVAALIDLSDTRRPLLSVDAGNPIPALRHEAIDLFVPTMDALRRACGDLEPSALLDAALRAGVRRVVATMGADGAMAAAADGTRCGVPAYPAEILSTLGAGDVFHGALLAAVVRGEPLPSCLGYAAAAAALSCRALDGRSAIPGHDEVVAALAA